MGNDRGNMALRGLAARPMAMAEVGRFSRGRRFGGRQRSHSSSSGFSPVLFCGGKPRYDRGAANSEPPQEILQPPVVIVERSKFRTSVPYSDSERDEETETSDISLHLPSSSPPPSRRSIDRAHSCSTTDHDYLSI